MMNNCRRGKNKKIQMKYFYMSTEKILNHEFKSNHKRVSPANLLLISKFEIVSHL